jgi:hypothetical protein
MFGICQSTKWMPYSSPGDDIYRSQIDVAWKDEICWLQPGSEPTQPLPRSNCALTRAEALAWRARAVPFMYASTVEEI